MRAWLHDRTSAHHSPKTYSQAYDLLESIDQHNASHVRVIYGGTDAKCRGGEFAGGVCAWNREHLWPQSFGVGESSGLTAGAIPRSDLHALVPSRAALNSGEGLGFRVPGVYPGCIQSGQNLHSLERMKTHAPSMRRLQHTYIYVLQ